MKITPSCTEFPGFGKYNEKQHFLEIRHALRRKGIAGRTVDTCYMYLRQQEDTEALFLA